MNLKFVYYYVFYSLLQIQLIHGICEYQFNKSTFKTPLWFDSDGNLLYPDINGKIELKSGRLFLQCSYVPTNNQPVNEIQIKDKSFKTVQVVCKSNVWHLVDTISEEFDPSEALCERDQLIHVWNARPTSPPFPLSKSAKDKCTSYDKTLQNSYLWNGIGLYTDKFKMVPLVENCLNIATSTPVFSVHHLKIKSNGFSEKKLSFVRGPPDNLPGFNPDNSYKQNVQEDLFKKILGNNFNKYFSTKLDYFDKGHLAPNADFPLDILRKATYYFSNALPQIAKLNQVQWLSVETAIRNLKTNLEVITGGSDVLQLLNSNDKKENIYLAQPRLPVPKYFWKIIRDSDQNTMGFYMINSPDETIQASRCSTYGWNLPTMIECFGPNDSTPFTSDLPVISSQGPLRGI